MSQVDFYILHARNRQEKARLVCQLADKAWHQGYRIYIHTQSQQIAKQLDIMLWTFKEESFLPHDIYPDISSSAPIRIGYLEQACEGMDVLINMTETIPSFFDRFARIAEIVDDTQMARNAGRTRYRFYRDRNYELKVHEMNR